MTQDEIIELARQAGFLTNEIKSYVISPYTFEDQDLYEEIEAFAKLVAEKEREACAEVCDEIYIHSIEDWEGANWCGDAIRARGQAC